MKFFQKKSVAIVLTLLLVALCCVWGYSRVYSNIHPHTEIEEPQRSGENNLNYYLNLVDDGADLFTLEVTDQIARKNLTINNTYGTKIAIKTVQYLNGKDIKTFAEDTAQNINMGSMDLLLVVDTDSKSWYVLYGADMQPYVDSATSNPLPALFEKHLNDDFFQDGSNDAILSLLDDFSQWCEENVPPLSDTGTTPFYFDGKAPSITIRAIITGILFTLAANIWWILLLLVVLNVIDRLRFDRHIAGCSPDAPPVHPFHPILFWHRPGSRWYENMTEQFFSQEEEDDEPFDDPSDGPSQDEGPREGERSTDWHSADPGSYTDAPGNFTETGPRPRSLGSQLWQLWESIASTGLSLCRNILAQIERFLQRRR